METITKGITTTRDNLESFIESPQHVQTSDTTELKQSEKEVKRNQNINPDGDILGLIVDDSMVERVWLSDICNFDVRWNP